MVGEGSLFRLKYFRWEAPLEKLHYRSLLTGNTFDLVGEHWWWKNDDLLHQRLKPQDNNGLQAEYWEGEETSASLTPIASTRTSTASQTSRFIFSIWRKCMLDVPGTMWSTCSLELGQERSVSWLASSMGELDCSQCQILLVVLLSSKKCFARTVTIQSPGNVWCSRGSTIWKKLFPPPVFSTIGCFRKGTSWLKWMTTQNPDLVD